MALGVIPVKGALDMTANRGTNAADGVAAQDLATVSQVGTATADQSWKNSVRVATIAAGTLATDFEAGDTVDGIVLALNDRILVQNQADAIENGIYVVQASGAPVRATDFATTTTGTSGSALKVEEGTINAGLEFVVTTTGNPIPGTDANNWALYPLAGLLNVIEDRSPAATTTSATFVNLATSASIAFDGNPVLFFLSLSAFATVGTTSVELAVQVDFGADNVISSFLINTANVHQAISGMVLITPTVGSHTINLQWRRLAGTGVVSVDGGDQVLLYAVRS